MQRSSQMTQSNGNSIAAQKKQQLCINEYLISGHQQNTYITWSALNNGFISKSSISCMVLNHKLDVNFYKFVLIQQNSFKKKYSKQVETGNKISKTCNLYLKCDRN